MTRRCSHCSANGHNSRTCPMRSGTGGGGGVRLFGVRLTDAGSIKKSASMGCLSHFASSSSPLNNRVDGSPDPPSGGDAAGYASDDPNRASCSANRRGERKKGTPWTEEEHRMFLVGLQKLGKGDWRGIARNYVLSRTPTQVASHAQKYFIRQTNASRRKRRSSLFDMIPDMPMDQTPLVEEQLLHYPPGSENTSQVPSLDLTLERESIYEDSEKEKQSSQAKENVYTSTSTPPLIPAFYPAYIPMPHQFWPPTMTMPSKEAVAGEMHEVLKPTPVLLKDSAPPDELVGMSKLSLVESNSGRLEPSALSSKLLSPSASRQSAFHINPAVASSDISQSNKNSAIHAL